MLSDIQQTLLDNAEPAFAEKMKSINKFSKQNK